ncbi:MAG: LysR family transcriptional regulator [Gammaproteobacteria bacterium]|jgi:DNA-binding transcriptional LysR family regulator|nr:LysR family transcriptional regulator [Gammaproteobacteria bacterium]MBK7171503.1 LysR family transcriptional regulator [Gammaproteobacteria bacterium]MBK7521332.1 LysR family transcriptional regulator [Gammaproteobacteria bacterium]MBK8307022.1 LysR family transcriptional regulator [Gammaproteobacteria bacterium]MBK9667969.1 LysR family transcriptional regulator [Gammaproteobacteria bacterium]
MGGAEFTQLRAFVAVAERCSFRKAANHLGLAPSTMSQTVRALEDRLDVRLLNRTTRSVRLTHAGELLLARVQPLLQDLAQSLHQVGNTDTGRLRLVASRAAARLALVPALSEFCHQHRNIELELTVDDTITDIVARGFDAGVRIGSLLEKDMVALPLTPDLPLSIVASPDYLRRYGEPLTTDDLRDHNCLRVVHPTTGQLFPWHLQDGPRRFDFIPSGNFSINDDVVLLQSLLHGGGIGCMLLADVQPYLDNGMLLPLLQDEVSSLPGFNVYYVRNRHMPAALRQLLDYLKEQRKW